jgi:hypothetical protein
VEESVAGSVVAGALGAGADVAGSPDGVVADSVGVVESDALGASLELEVAVGVEGWLATGSDVTVPEVPDDPDVGVPEEAAPDEGALVTAAADCDPEPVVPGAVVLRDGVVDVADEASGDGTTFVGCANAGAEAVASGETGVAARCFGAFAADDAELAEPVVDPVAAGESATDSAPSAATAATAWSPSTCPSGRCETTPKTSPAIPTPPASSSTRAARLRPPRAGSAIRTGPVQSDGADVGALRGTTIGDSTVCGARIGAGTTVRGSGSCARVVGGASTGAACAGDAGTGVGAATTCGIGRGCTATGRDAGAGMRGCAAVCTGVGAERGSSTGPVPSRSSRIPARERATASAVGRREGCSSSIADSSDRSASGSAASAGPAGAAEVTRRRSSAPRA